MSNVLTKNWKENGKAVKGLSCEFKVGKTKFFCFSLFFCLTSNKNTLY